MHSVRITEENHQLESLQRSWTTAVYTCEDGIGPMGSLHEAGNALVAVAHLADDTTTVLGSGVMIGPGIVVVATHVLEEFERHCSTPVLLTFLPNGARAWLPKEKSSVSGPSAFGDDRRVISDVTLLSCTLNSDAHRQHPLMLAPLQIALPLQGERLWAFGYRHERLDEDAAVLTPLVASGLVTAVYPTGRGERMRSACVEVAMDTKGGMSGGPVVNASGNLVGIVSSSFEGGPSYVTLVWEALRYSIKNALPSLSGWGDITLFSARELGLVRFKGAVERSKIGNVTMTLSEAETKLMLETADPAAISRTPPGVEPIVGEELDAFEEEWLSAIESEASASVLARLGDMPLSQVQEILSAAGVMYECLPSIQDFVVEDFEGVEDPDLQSVRRIDDGTFEIVFAFDMLSIRWTVEVPTQDYLENGPAFDASFLNAVEDGEITRLDLYQRFHFETGFVLDPTHSTVTDFSMTFVGVIVRPQNERRKRLIGWKLKPTL